MLDKVSVTDISTFRDCRRKWYLSRVMHLESAIPIKNLWFGTGIHAALDGYYGALMDPENERPLVDVALEAYAEWYVKEESKLEEAHGGYWSEEQKVYIELYTLGREMIQNYADMERSLPAAQKFDPPYNIEKRVQVPLLTEKVGIDGKQLPVVVHPKTGQRYTPVLVGRMDLVTFDKDRDFYTIIDHKTAKNKRQNSESIDIDEQLTGYAYIFWRLSGIVPREILHNVLIKEAIEDPKVNKNGSLSVNKTQKTTHERFLTALQDRKLDPSPYLEMLDVLRTKGWSDFFFREFTARNETQLINFEKRLYNVFMDMLECSENFALAYPNPSVFRCSFCSFLPVCHAYEDGSDAQAIIDTQFIVRERTTVEEVAEKDIV